MAFDEALAQEVRIVLRGYKVIEKRMFGGLAFMVHGKMCVSVNNKPDHIMMVRINPKDQEEGIRRKGASIAVMRGKQMNGWIFLTKEAIASEKDFNYWINLALDFNKQVTR